jgi:protein-tyrosine phosphatase
MIDLHCHIIPEVDDGPVRLEHALEMARAAVDDGIDTVVATPHGTDIAGLLAGHEIASQDYIAGRTAWLQDRLQEAGIPLEVFPGIEVHISPDVPAQITSRTVFGLNNTKYMLSELPFEHYPQYIDDVLFNIQVKGFVPVLAHPERNSVLREKPERLLALVERGCLVQVTAASILGFFGNGIKQATAELLRSNLVHIISTDAHGVGRRDPVLSAAVAEAAKIVGQERALAMVTTIPAAIIAGERIDLPEPSLPKKRWQIFGGARG